MPAHVINQQDYRLTNAHHNKFWNIRLVDTSGRYSVEVHFGAIGTKGQKRTIVDSTISKDEAIRTFQRSVDAKTRKGYVRHFVPPAPANAAPTQTKPDKAAPVAHQRAAFLTQKVDLFIG